MSFMSTYERTGASRASSPPEMASPKAAVQRVEQDDVEADAFHAWPVPVLFVAHIRALHEQIRPLMDRDAVK